jgi:hypothetical protein
MTLPFHPTLHETQRLGRVALTALMIGLGGAAVVALPLGNIAFAGNGNGGGNGGGHGHDGGHGGGHGGGGNGGGGNGGGGKASSHDGTGSNAKAGKSGPADSTTEDASADESGEDDSMSAQNLGKLNGFFHASLTGLANASPNSSIGRISHTFKDALSDFAKANAPTDPNNPDATDPNATPPSGPTTEELGAILADSTNKTVTADQVKAIVDRLAETNPDDASLNDLADSMDDETAQDIADAANAAKSGETPDDSTDGSSDDATGDTGTDGTDTTTATN